MLCWLNFAEAKELIRKSVFDFQTFCQIRDENKHIIDEFETIECSFCQSNHTKMKCPKLHYLPLKQMKIYKYLHNLKIQTNPRKRFLRQF